MQFAGLFSQVTSTGHLKWRLGDLDVVVAALLAERFEAQLQPDGSMLLLLTSGVTLRLLWRMRSMEVSRRDMAYLLLDLDRPLSWADVLPWLPKLSEPSSRGVLVKEGDFPCHV